MGRKQDKALLEQIRQMMLAQMQQTQAPDPNITRLLGLNNSILDWHTNPNNTVKDIYKHPTLGAKLPVFELMKKNLDAGRIGRGVVGRTNMSKSQYADDMKLQDDMERSMAAGGVLESGLRDELDGAQANIAKLTDLDYARKSGQLSGLGSLYSLHKDLSSKISQGGWGGFLRSMLGGLAGSL